MPATASRDVLLQTPHLQDAVAFYRNLLGMKVFLQTPALVGLDAGTYRLFLEQAEPLGPVFEFLVEDVATARRQLLDNGCIVLVDDPTIPRLYLRDPFGLLFNLAARQPETRTADHEPEDRGNERPPHY